MTWTAYVDSDPVSYTVSVYLRRPVGQGEGEYAVLGSDGSVNAHRVGSGVEGPAFLTLTLDNEGILQALGAALESGRSRDETLNAVIAELRDQLKTEQARVDRLFDTTLARLL